MKFKDKIVIVTGASSGIGESIAEAFATEGANVITVARRSNLLVEKVSNSKGKLFPFKADLTKDNEVEKLIASVVNKFGKVDILVNNAGIALGGKIDDFSMKDFDDMFNLNIRGLYFCTKLVIPIMKKQKSGIIINISSGSGKKGSPTQSAYGASKAAVIKMSESIAEELKEYKIKVHTVCPGMVAVKNHYPNLKKEKMLQPSDVADLTIFLAKLPQRVNIPEVTIVPYYPIHMLRD